MTDRHLSNRREFLQGDAARKAVEQFADGIRSEQAAQTPRTELAEPAYLVQLARTGMAVDFQVFLNAGDPTASTELACEALDLLEPLEQQMSVYREASEVSRLNQIASIEPVEVEARLFRLLELAQLLARETDGAYDMTSGPLTKVWGFYRRQGRMPATEEIETALAKVGFEKIQLNAALLTLHFKQPGMELNLGGIGKGYALDCLAQQLRSAGAEHFLLHGGHSSVLASGSRAGLATDEAGWSIGLAHPLRPTERLAEFRLSNRALGTSGSGTQYFHYQGKRYGHILDPRTGVPAEGVLSSTALAPTAAEADALSTAFYVGGLELARQVCGRMPEISALLLVPGEKTGEFVLEDINLPAEQWRRL